MQRHCIYKGDPYYLTVGDQLNKMFRFLTQQDLRQRFAAALQTSHLSTIEAILMTLKLHVYMGKTALTRTKLEV